MPKVLGKTNVCAICNKEKPLEEFARGHRKCKECYKVIQKNNYKKRMLNKNANGVGPIGKSTDIADNNVESADTGGSVNSNTELIDNTVVITDIAITTTNKTRDNATGQDKNCNVVTTNHNSTDRLKLVIISTCNTLLSEMNGNYRNDKFKLTQMMLSLLSNV